MRAVSLHHKFMCSGLVEALIHPWGTSVSAAWGSSKESKADEFFTSMDVGSFHADGLSKYIHNFVSDFAGQFMGMLTVEDSDRISDEFEILRAALVRFCRQF